MNFIRDPLSPWNCLVQLLPIRVGDDVRMPAIAWETVDGSNYKMRGTITFDRWGELAKTRFFVDGYALVLGEDGCVTESTTRVFQEIRLPTKMKWRTQSIKVRGSTSFGRSIGINFEEDHDDPRSLVGLEVIVPMNEEVDEGKRLELAVEWARKVVDANIAWTELFQYEFVAGAD